MRTKWKFFLIFVFSFAMISQGYYLRKLKKSFDHLRSLSSLLDIPLPIKGLHEIVNNYDIFLLDQFGVLHDGIKPMNGVNEALDYLHSLNKTTIILSNTASRSKIAKKRYAQLGLPSHYTDFITSGEASSQYLHDNYRGKKCTWITWSSYSKDKTLHDLEIQAADIRDADFLFLHGTQTVVNSFSEESLNKPINFFADGDVTHPLIDEIISIGIERKIPAICANMDLTAMAYGQTAYMPGKIMKEYERRGGRVISFGKPMKEFFDFAISKAPSPERNPSPGKRTRRRIIHVGDSLHHDIAGAHATGIDSLLITAHGVHSKVLHLPEDASISHEEKCSAILSRVLRVCDEESVPRPSYILGSFTK